MTTTTKQQQHPQHTHIQTHNIMIKQNKTQTKHKPTHTQQLKQTQTIKHITTQNKTTTTM